jgi:hypothetical protein
MRETSPDPITWRRLRAIFGDPPLVQHVTQRQFDYFDEKLQELGRTRYDQIDMGDMWFYHHDLAYVDLQPDLFAHLFPVCLMDWHRTLLANEPCSHGDSEFHYGVLTGDVFANMLTRRQRSDVEAVFRDSLLYRIDQERGFAYDGMRTPAYGWMFRLNSLGLVSNELPALWQAWWNARTPGRAVALLQYCSGLMYFDGENPLFDAWTPDAGGGGPYLWENDSYVYDRGWPDENVAFLRAHVTSERVAQAVRDAAAALRHEPEGDLAARIAVELDERLELIASRVAELPSHLASLGTRGWQI